MSAVYGSPARTITSIWAVALFAIIAAVPVGLMMARAFCVDGALTLANFKALFFDARQAMLFFRSLILAGATALAALAAGVPMAFGIHRFRIAGHRLIKCLYLLPLAIPSQVFVATWLTLAAPLGMAAGNPTAAAGQGFAGLPIAVLLLTAAYYPLVVLTALAGLGALDRRLEESGHLVQSPRAVFRRITLPLLSPYIVTGGVFVFLFALFNYGVPALLGIHTYPVEIFTQFSAFYNEGRATALSCPLILAAFGLLAIVQKQMGSRAFFTISTGSSHHASHFDDGSHVISTVWCWAAIVLSVLLPLGVLLAQAASWRVMAAVIKTSSGEIVSTFILAALAAFTIVFIGYPLADRISAARKGFWTFMDFFTLLPFAVPATVLGIGMIYLWNRPVLDHIYAGAAILVIALSARFITFAIRMISAGLGQVAPSLWEAAALYQPSALRRWHAIQWPLLKKSLAVGWLTGFVFSMNELGATLLVIPPGYGTLSLKIYNLMHYGANQMVAGMALVLVMINLSVAGIVYKAFMAEKAG